MPFVDLGGMLRGSPLPGWSGRFFHSENMTFAHWDISAGAADLHEHQHPGEEVWTVVEGELLLRVDEQERRLGPGDAAIIPPDVRHSATALGACRALVVDHPVRPQLPGVDTS